MSAGWRSEGGLHMSTTWLRRCLQVGKSDPTPQPNVIEKASPFPMCFRRQQKCSKRSLQPDVLTESSGRWEFLVGIVACTRGSRAWTEAVHGKSHMDPLLTFPFSAYSACGRFLKFLRRWPRNFRTQQKALSCKADVNASRRFNFCEYLQEWAKLQ